MFLREMSQGEKWETNPCDRGHAMAVNRCFLRQLLYLDALQVPMINWPDAVNLV